MSDFRYSYDSNPWANNYFKPPTEVAPAPQLNPAVRPSRHKPIPDQREVFAIQKALTRSLEGLTDLERENESLDTTKVRRDLESAYRKIVRYLDHFAQ